MIGQYFFLLLKLGIETANAHNKECETLLMLSMEQWRGLMGLAEKQGVTAIAIDGVQRLYDTYGKEIKAASETPAEWTQWVLECAGVLSRYEQMCLNQRKTICELSDIWAKEGISMLVFKGLANAVFYSVPGHRATGDIDCWLFGDAEEGDDVLKEAGAIVDNRWYRHSKISYKGETIENHRVFSHTRGSRKKKAMEEELRLMVHGEGLKVIDDCGRALLPPVQFNACFLTYHGLHHFLSEGLRMKQILDWTMFIKAEQDKVDWNTFNDFCEKYRLERFAAVMNYIAEKYLNVDFNHNLNDNQNEDIERLSEMVMKSTLYDDDYLFNSGKSDWMVRWLLVKNMLTRDRWKYKDVAQENVWMHLWENAIGYLKEKD